MKISQKRLKRASMRAENSIAEALGGRRTFNSGAGLVKGDARVLGKFRIETKCPPTGKHRLSSKDWGLLQDAARESHEVPLFHLKLGAWELIILRYGDYVEFLGKDPGHEEPSFDTKTALFDPTSGGTSCAEHHRFNLQHQQPGKAPHRLIALPRRDFLGIVENYQWD